MENGVFIILFTTDATTKVSSQVFSLQSQEVEIYPEFVIYL